MSFILSQMWKVIEPIKGADMHFLQFGELERMGHDSRLTSKGRKYPAALGESCSFIDKGVVSHEPDLELAEGS